MYRTFNSYKNDDLDYLKLLKETGRKAIIFGAGVGGQKLIKKLREKEIEIAYICDNDESKIGKKLEKITIIGFKNLI